MAGGKKSEPIVVAQIMGKWVGGGVEAVIMNYYRHIDRTKVQFDFICDEDSTNIPYEEIEKLGGKVILCPPYQKLGKYMKFLENLFREKKYRIVHSNINTLSVFPLRAARKAGVPVRIAHSHATSNRKELRRHIIKSVLKKFSCIYATDFFCCSKSAGEYMFGKKYLSGNVVLIKNAIDIKEFQFNNDARMKYRNLIGVGDSELLIGNVGRICKTKNQKYALKVFKELNEAIDSKVVFIGDGAEKSALVNAIKKDGLEGSVILLGQTSDIAEWYSAMDILVHPSLYEGFGMTLLEAQISGLPCVVSKNVPSEANVSGDICFEKITSDVSEWVDSILKIAADRETLDRSRGIHAVSEGFDIEREAVFLQQKYMEMAR